MSHEYAEQPGDGVTIEGRKESLYVYTEEKDELVAYEDGHIEIGKKTMKALVAYFSKFPERMAIWE